MATNLQRNAEEVKILGLALSKEDRDRLDSAFAGAARQVSAVEQLRGPSGLRLGSGPAVIFCYIPASASVLSIHDSAALSNLVVKLVGLHPCCNKEVYDTAFDAGMDGVLDCKATPEMYRRVLSSVLGGELWYSRSYLSRKTRELRRGKLPEGLSPRESEIFHLASSGTSNQCIADRLCISRDTVRWHLRSIHTKLGTSSRGHLHALGRKTFGNTQE